MTTTGNHASVEVGTTRPSAVATEQVAAGQRAWRRVGVGAGVVLLYLGPTILGTSRLIFLAATGLIFAIVALGLSVLYGDGGQMSVAHGALWGCGAYTAAITSREWGLSFWIALPLAALVAAAAATLIGIPSLRVRGHYFLIVTFAFAELFRVLMVNLRDFSGGNQGVLVLDAVHLPFFGELTSPKHFYYLSATAVVITGAIVMLIRGSTFGASLHALRENETLAQALGLPLTRYKITAFCISGAIAGVAGVIYAYLLRHIEPALFGAFAGIQMVLILLIGGARHVAGPALGAGLFFLAPEAVSLDPVDTQLFYGALLIAVVLFAPAGLANAVPAAGRRVAARILPFTETERR